MNKEKITIGINGFGRIGRNLYRLLLNHPSIEVIAINDLADTKTLSHLLKYDSIHGVLKEEISFTENQITVANKKVNMSSEKNIEDIKLVVSGAGSAALACSNLYLLLAASSLSRISAALSNSRITEDAAILLSLRSSM